MSLQVQRIPMGMANAYLIESERGLVLVDAGAAHCERFVLRRMKALGRDDLKLVFITHAHLDHYGSARVLREQTGAPIAVHSADGAAMASGESPAGSGRGWRGRLMVASLRVLPPRMSAAPTPPDVLLEDGDDLSAYGLDATVLHTPGHTPGSACLIVERRLAFVGDLLTASPAPHVQRLLAHDWSLIPSSFARLKALRPESVYVGHGRGQLSGAALERLLA